MKNEKTAIVFAAVLALTQVRAAFASPNDDFLKYLKANDMQKLEKLVNSKAKNMDLGKAMGSVFFEDSFNKANTFWVIQLLVRNGAKADQPLVLIAFLGNFTQQQRVDIARYLLDNGANVNAMYYGLSPNGYSTIALAVDGRNWELAKLLLEKRANPNGRFDDDSTALIWAAKEDYNEIAYELVESGANVNLRNTAGETAASIAYDRGNMELYNYLVAYGAVFFDPKQAAAPPPAQAPQSTTTNVYVQPSAPASSGYSGSSSQQAQQPKKRMFTGQVWYLDNGTRKSIPLMEQAFTADEAEKAAERKFKTGPVGLQKGVIFLEAVAN